MNITGDGDGNGERDDDDREREEPDEDDTDEPTAAANDALDPRVRRILEIVYEVEGVVAAKVWALPGQVAIAVRVGSRHGSTDVIAQIANVTIGLREPGEAWDFGLLEGDA
jgi:hypothetical protein